MITKLTLEPNKALPPRSYLVAGSPELELEPELLLVVGLHEVFS